ncbi:MAG: peroxide stress protein YaaA, partial [Paludibacter sp.]|nr:peroxide stress protein YaaA [Paludibacter sp.]
MIVLLSPAKIQNFNKQVVTSKFSIPEFLDEASELVELMRQLSQEEITKLLEINVQLTRLNLDRYIRWQLPFTPENAKQAVFVFDGEVYRGLDAQTLSPEEIDYLQQHLRLFSGLYGVLKPLDLMQPYRLDVSSKLNNYAGKDLYPFWKKKVTESIAKELKTSGEPQLLLNLASSEYAKLIDLKGSKMRMINVEFLEYHDDKLKQIVVYTKKARGMMTRYVIQNRIEDEEDLKGFNESGYWFNEQLSSKN